MMRRLHVLVSGALGLTLLAGCQSNSTTQEPVAAHCSRGLKVVDYTTNDPRLEPTLNVGGFLEVRTTDGGPVVLQSQVDQQRRAAEAQRAANEAAATVAPVTVPAK